MMVLVLLCIINRLIFNLTRDFKTTIVKKFVDVGLSVGEGLLVVDHSTFFGNLETLI